jgi:hypothetical protein
LDDAGRLPDCWVLGFEICPWGVRVGHA